MSEWRPENRDCSGDPAAYVLGALEPDEVDAFREHMVTCVVCRDEVATFERVADVLPSAVPQYRVPRSLRKRVMREVRAHPRAPEQPPRRAWPISLSLIPRPALAAASLAAAAVIAIVVIATASGGSGARLLNASVVGLPGSAQVRVAHGRAELIVRDFPSPPAGHIYEVWLERGSAPPAPTNTLFSVNSAGTADVGVSGSLRGVSAVLVTPEPNGGSPVPTHAPVIVARLD